MDRRITPSHLLRVMSGLAGTMLPLCASHAGEVTSRSGVDRCAVYGPGFSAVDGSDTCVRIGGRVRVEAGNGTFSPNTGWAQNGIVPAGATDDQTQRRHLRLTDSTPPRVDPFAR